jgi:hypothetical protein
MLIGNRERFAMEMSPVAPSWQRRHGPERAAWAGLAIWANGLNLCRHVRSGEEEIRDVLHIPLAPIADWIVRNHAALAFQERAAAFSIGRRPHEALRAWGEAPPLHGLDEDRWLDAREAFWQGHFLAAGAEGSHVPNIAFVREDDDVVVTWRAPRFVAPPHAEMLHADGSTTAPWHEVNQVLLEFVGHVADAFKDANVPAPFPWMGRDRQAWDSFEPKHAVVLYCGRSLADVEALVGPVGPILDSLSHGDPGASPSLQIVRDLPPRPSASIGDEIQRTVELARTKDPSRSTAWLAGRAISSDAARAGTTPEEQGYLAARSIREDLELDGQPIESVSDLVTHYGVQLSQSRARSAQERMVVAGRLDGSAAATVLLTGRTERRWGRRFEEARALGHALLDTMRQGAFGAASTTWAQESRRRRSGAFAAELLLPSSALGALSDGALDGIAEGERFADILKRYGIGARTAAYQLHNHGWLSDTSIRDDLIEEYGYREG